MSTAAEAKDVAGDVPDAVGVAAVEVGVAVLQISCSLKPLRLKDMARVRALPP